MAPGIAAGREAEGGCARASSRQDGCAPGVPPGGRKGSSIFSRPLRGAISRTAPGPKLCPNVASMNPTPLQRKKHQKTPPSSRAAATCLTLLAFKCPHAWWSLATLTVRRVEPPCKQAKSARPSSSFVIAAREVRPIFFDSFVPAGPSEKKLQIGGAYFLY